jgi:hypothetical protein
MADRSPSTIIDNKDRIARTAAFMKNELYDIQLLSILLFSPQLHSSSDWLVHVRAPSKMRTVYEDWCPEDTKLIVEWKDNVPPVLFDYCYVASTKEDEMTFVASHLVRGTNDYSSVYETLRVSKTLLNRGIIEIRSNEIVNRFSRLILE